jgi:DNA-binding beta-propeller fold protein YncE
MLVADTASNVLFEIRKPDAACMGAEVLGKIPDLGLSAPRFITWGRYPGGAAVTNARGNSVAVFRHKSTGDPRTPSIALELDGSPVSDGGLKGPAGIAIDDDGNAWVANNAPGANSISEIARVTEMFDKTPGTRLPLSPESGFTGTGLDHPFGIAIDNSGNVWVTNQGDNSVTVFISVAHPSY